MILRFQARGTKGDGLCLTVLLLNCSLLWWSHRWGWRVPGRPRSGFYMESCIMEQLQDSWNVRGGQTLTFVEDLEDWSNGTNGLRREGGGGCRGWGGRGAGEDASQSLDPTGEAVAVINFFFFVTSLKMYIYWGDFVHKSSGLWNKPDSITCNTIICKAGGFKIRNYSKPESCICWKSVET